MRKLVGLFYFVSCIVSSYGQKGQSAHILKVNDISIVKGYVWTMGDRDETLDSSLITVELYNDHGYKTRLDVYGDGDICSRYTYDYKGDSLRTQRETYSGSDLQYCCMTTLVYNDRGQVLTEEDYDENGVEASTKLMNTYNKENQLIGEELVVDGERKYKRKYKHDYLGRIKEMRYAKFRKYKMIYYYDERGNHIASNVFYKRRYRFNELKRTFDDKNRVISEIRWFTKYKKVLGLAGRLEMKKKDQLETKTFYLSDGLVDYKEQYINGDLNAIKRYAYSRDDTELKQ